MPCWIYLRGDPDAIMSNDSADTIIQRLGDAEDQDAFVSLADIPMAHDDKSRTAYVRASAVAAVIPMHPRRYEAELDDPPDWYTDYGN